MKKKEGESSTLLSILINTDLKKNIHSKKLGSKRVEMRWIKEKYETNKQNMMIPFKNSKALEGIYKGHRMTASLPKISALSNMINLSNHWIISFKANVIRLHI